MFKAHAYHPLLYTDLAYQSLVNSHAHLPPLSSLIKAQFVCLLLQSRSETHCPISDYKKCMLYNSQRRANVKQATQTKNSSQRLHVLIFFGAEYYYIKWDDLDLVISILC